MAKYKVVERTIYHDGAAFKAGEDVELFGKDADLLGDAIKYVSGPKEKPVAEDPVMGDASDPAADNFQVPPADAKKPEDDKKSEDKKNDAKK